MGILGKLAGESDAPRMVEGQKWDTRKHKEKYEYNDDEDEEEESLMSQYVYRAPAVEDTTPIFGIEDDDKENPVAELADIIKKAESIEKGRADALQLAKETFLQNGIPAVALADAFKTILQAAERGDRDAAKFLEINESRLPAKIADFGRMTHKQRVDSIIKRDEARTAAARHAERAAQRVNVRVKERGMSR